MFNAEHLQEKWDPILSYEGAPKIQDAHRKMVTAVLLENQEKSMQEEGQVMDSQNFITEGLASGSMDNVDGVAKFDPILISLVRRSMPNLIAYDVCGVQPMTGPTGLIFAMKAKYEALSGSEALYDAADTSFSSN